MLHEGYLIKDPLSVKGSKKEVIKRNTKCGREGIRERMTKNITLQLVIDWPLRNYRQLWREPHGFFNS